MKILQTETKELIHQQKILVLNYHLQSLQKPILPPTKEEDILQQWYGCIYQKCNKAKGSKKQALFVVKATPHFLSDENGKTSTGNKKTKA